MTVENVIHIVADSMGIKPELITSRDRTEAVANARAVVQSILRSKGWTLKRIAEVFMQGHGTVMHSVVKVENARQIANAYDAVQQIINKEKQL